MKKTIEIEIPNHIGLEGETKDMRAMMIERKANAIARAIAKRAKVDVPEGDTIKYVEKVIQGKPDKQGNPGKNVTKIFKQIEFDLTKTQIDALPIGLKKLFL